MPLFKSASKKAVGENIKTEVGAGRPQKQAIAIAMQTRRDAAKRAGKRLVGMGARPRREEK